MVQQLTSALEAERATSASEDSDLIALLSAKLSARSLRRNKVLEETSSRALEAVDSVTKSRGEASERRIGVWDEMGERREWIGATVKDGLGEVEKRSQEGVEVRSLGSSAGWCRSVGANFCFDR